MPHSESRSSEQSLAPSVPAWARFLQRGTALVARLLGRRASPPEASAEPPRELPPPTPPTLSPRLEICPYCAQLTSEDSNLCRGCGRNPFLVDGSTANRSLTVEELLCKATRLYAHGCADQALETHLFATRRYSNLRQAWQGLLEAPNAEASMRSEARQQLDRIARTIYS